MSDNHGLPLLGYPCWPTMAFLGLPMSANYGQSLDRLHLADLGLPTSANLGRLESAHVGPTSDNYGLQSWGAHACQLVLVLGVPLLAYLGQPLLTDHGQSLGHLHLADLGLPMMANLG